MSEVKKAAKPAPAAEKKPAVEKKPIEIRKAVAPKGEYIAAILIRSLINKTPDQRKALDVLRLRSRHLCIVLKDTPSNRGMMHKVKDCVTYGEIDYTTFKLLKDKRGETRMDREGKAHMLPVFRLHPPRGGFERKGIKMPFSLGGALGDRGAQIKELIER